MKISPRLMVIAALFVTCLITANTIAVKLVNFGSIVLPAAVIIFPVSYIIGDILTEVYGYTWARRIIWVGFACNLLFVIFVTLGGILPGASFWTGQEAYNAILGYTPRLLLASFMAFLAGSFANSFVLARMKVLTRGRYLWTRTIGSTIVGEGIDSAIFITLAFVGTPFFLPIVIIYQWVFKTMVEVVATPVTYAVVNWLKAKEDINPFDVSTNFNPFSLHDTDAAANSATGK